MNYFNCSKKDFLYKLNLISFMDLIEMNFTESKCLIRGVDDNILIQTIISGEGCLELQLNINPSVLLKRLKLINSETLIFKQDNNYLSVNDCSWASFIPYEPNFYSNLKLLSCNCEKELLECECFFLNDQKLMFNFLISELNCIYNLTLKCLQNCDEGVFDIASIEFNKGFMQVSCTDTYRIIEGKYPSLFSGNCTIKLSKRDLSILQKIFHRNKSVLKIVFSSNYIILHDREIFFVTSLKEISIPTIDSVLTKSDLKNDNLEKICINTNLLLNALEDAEIVSRENSIPYCGELFFENNSLTIFCESAVGKTKQNINVLGNSNLNFVINIKFLKECLLVINEEYFYIFTKKNARMILVVSASESVHFLISLVC